MAAASGGGDKKEKKVVREYNPRFNQYLGIGVLSLANWASVSGINGADDIKAEWAVSLMFGVATCFFCCLVMLFDRITCLNDKFDFKKYMDGKLEGYFLLFTVFWWAGGVAFMTRVGGTAYNTLNIYFSCWFTLFACCYTLNDWSAEKDIISAQELTHLSATLPSWYSLFFASVVEMGSAADAFRKLKKINRDGAAFAVAVGSVSIFFSLFFILLHYKLISFCKFKPGGWFELVISFMMNIWWTLGVGVLTQDGEIAATIIGYECQNDRMPGSNLYLSLWAGFFSSGFVTVRWKAAQALQFAQAQNRMTTADGAVIGRSSQGRDDDDDDDNI